jgi:hypothetical protein
MSLRRAVEFNFKERLQRAFEGTRYAVVEGVSNKERPNPCIIVLAGEGTSAFPNLSDSLGNYNCDVSIIVLSSLDVDGVDQHNDAVDIVSRTLSGRDVRKVSLVENLYLYDFIKISVAESNEPEGRKIGTVFNYKATVNYYP